MTQLIAANLRDRGCRNLMLLTRNVSALRLLFSCELLDERTADVLFGSAFPEDLSELHLVR